VVIAGLLTAQAMTLGVTASGKRSLLRNKLYPIIEYPMYAPAHYEGERVTATWELQALLSSGETMPISREALELTIWDYNRIVQAFLRGDPRATENFEEVIRTRAPRASEIREVRIISYGVQLGRNGPIKIPSQVVRTIKISGAS
jgi:hypothetical protein